ncbi:MAG: EamA family transporter [Mesorhizobium sp.]|nr:MAG: EamA family transporter [Mesorhizobium sp.]
MNATVVGLALSAAILHASWNAFLRTGVDRLWTVTVMSFSSTAAAIVLALFHPLPAAAAWPYVVLSAVLQVGYSVFLVAAYRYGELGQVYPIVRGSVPLLVALAGQRLAAPELIGVALVACGIMGLSVGRGRASVTSILYALATGVIIAAYATVDAIGVRVAGDSAAYTAWVLLIYGALLPAAFVGLRGRLTVDLRAPETRKALSGGLFALLAYGAVVAAFAQGPAGPITAIRETSVVFAAFIGRFFLGEQLTPRRIGACAVVALGAICLGYRP